jgi:hypothetical protein
MLRCVVIGLLLLSVAACRSPAALTAEAAHCSASDTSIVPSAYSREGSTTVWCATCKDKLYYCVSNPDRDRVVCKEATEESRCR